MTAECVMAEAQHTPVVIVRNGIEYTQVQTGAAKVTGVSDKSITEAVVEYSVVSPQLETLYVTDIGANAFAGCDALESVVAESVTLVGSNVFEGCTSLTRVKLPKVKDVATDMFKDCTSLTEVELGGIENLHAGMFSGSQTLERLSLPNVVGISDGALSGCVALLSLETPSVRWIGSRVFEGCTSLASYTTPPLLESIGGELFVGCTNLKTVTFGSPKLYILCDDNDLSWNNGERQSPLLNCESVETVNIVSPIHVAVEEPPLSSYTRYPMYYNTFYVGLPSVGAGMFEGCTSLREVNLSAINFLPNGALANLPALRTIILSDDITYMEEDAVTGSDVERIVCPSSVPPVLSGLGKPIEADRQKCQIVVPEGTAEEYRKSLFWGTFSNVVEDETLQPLFGVSAMMAGRRIGDDGFVLNYDGNTVSTALPCYSFVEMDEEYPVFKNSNATDDYYEPMNKKYLDGFVAHIGNRVYEITGIAPYAYCCYDGTESVSLTVHHEIAPRCTYIGDYAFYRSQLSLYQPTIELPLTMRYIGRKAFAEMREEVTLVMCNALTPPEMDETAFGDRSKIDLQVPMGTGDLYAAAPGWRDFRSITQSWNLGAVEDIEADATVQGEPEYYTLDGLRVDKEQLRKGIYVRRAADGTVTKVRR